MAKGPSGDEIFDAMTKAVEEDPTLKSRFNASVVFKLGDNSTYRLDATKGSPKEKPDLTVMTTLDVFHELLDKKVTPQQAFMKGKLKIKGKMGLAMKLPLILKATRKQLSSSTGTPRSRL